MWTTHCGVGPYVTVQSNLLINFFVYLASKMCLVCNCHSFLVLEHVVVVFFVLIHGHGGVIIETLGHQL